MFKVIFFTLIFGGLIAFSTYQIVQIVRIIKQRKNAKSKQKELESDDRHSNS